MTTEKGLATRVRGEISQDIFVAMDRLDDEQIIAEMRGLSLNEYVYEFEESGQKVRGLSKAGTDDASRLMAIKYGEILREVEVTLEMQDEEYGYFKAKVTRFVIGADGVERELESAIGQKRQGKFIIRRDGSNGGPNRFWYEQGGQKALRNAKQKLMPEPLKQAIIQEYINAGKVRRDPVVTTEEPPIDAEYTEQPEPQPRRTTARQTTAKPKTTEKREKTYVGDDGVRHCNLLLKNGNVCGDVVKEAQGQWGPWWSCPSYKEHAT